MSLFLEKFSAFTAPRQASDLQGLVNNEAEWLAEERPGTLKRYETQAKAIRSIWRIAADPGIEAYIVKSQEDKVAVGVATIILGVTVAHPDHLIGSRTGNDLDYWTGPGIRTTEHVEIAKALIKESAKPNLVARRTLVGSAINQTQSAREAVYSVMAVIPVDRINPPKGLMGNSAGYFPEHLEPLGLPSNLSLTSPMPDRYGIIDEVKEMQLYYGFGIAVEE